VIKTQTGYILIILLSDYVKFEIEDGSSENFPRISEKTIQISETRSLLGFEK
jgi:hypothetical protein